MGSSLFPPSCRGGWGGVKEEKGGRRARCELYLMPNWFSLFLFRCSSMAVAVVAVVVVMVVVVV